MLSLLTPQAAARLERKLQDPRTFGLAKSFMLLGKEAGFDMEAPEGMQAWVAAYNATVAPMLAAAARPPGPPTKKQARAMSKGTRSALRRKRKNQYA
jgi:hypothetical protein